MEQTAAPYLVELPADESAAWQLAAGFLQHWRGVTAGTGTEDLSGVEAALGHPIPGGLRDFYRRFGTPVRSGCFNDREISLFTPEHLYLDDGSAAEDSHPTLVIGADRWGSMWGFRHDELGHESPRIRCVNGDGGAYDGAFGLTEFLVGLLFRSAVINAPVRFTAGPFPNQWDLVDRIHGELLEVFPEWQRDGQGEDFGLLSHIESPELLALLSAEALTIGLRSHDSLRMLPEPLRGLVTSLSS